MATVADPTIDRLERLLLATATQQRDIARRCAMDLEQENARLRELCDRLLKEWGAEQDHELRKSDRFQDPDGNAYQRGATLERCGDDLAHVLEHGELPDWVDTEEEAPGARTDNRRRIYLDGKGQAWIGCWQDDNGNQGIRPIDSPAGDGETTQAVRERTGSLREIGRTR